jgi:hypothetical protein
MRWLIFIGARARARLAKRGGVLDRSLWFRGQDRFLDRLWATANLAQRGQKAFKQTVDGALNRCESAEKGGPPLV